jgi:signal transduction histidine kinase
LGNTIWVLNKSDQTLTSLFDKLKTWTGKLLISYPGIKCRFEEQIDCDTKLSPKQSLNWLYILQEAINNAVKHSKGNLILVRLQAGSDWSVLVMDNGSGLVHAETAGQGLRSMKERYERMGWSGEWVSAHSDGGTKFRLASKVV